jgi:hypothetical protein
VKSANHTARGKFAPGNRANPVGRPSTERRMHLVVEQMLRDAGATPEEIQRLVRAAGDPVRAATAIALMVAAVAERREQSTPSSADPTHAEASSTR